MTWLLLLFLSLFVLFLGGRHSLASVTKAVMFTNNVKR